MTVSNLGTAAYVQKDYEAARSFYEESAAMCRKLGTDWALAAPLTKLGLVAFRQGDLDRAEAILKESVAVQRDIGEKWFLSLGVEGLARILAAQGRHARRRAAPGGRRVLAGGRGAAVLPFYLYDHDWALTALRTALGNEAFNVLWSEGRAMTLAQAVAYALADADGPEDDPSS